MLLPLFLSVSGAVWGANGWPVSMDALRKRWTLQAVPAPRAGVWVSPIWSKGDQRVLVRPDSAKDGSVRSLSWWAESGPREIDLPEDAFWGILDALSGNEEWTETDPDALPQAFLKGMEATAAQGFVCHACAPNLAAATWVSHGTTRLRVATLGAAAHARVAEPGLAKGVTTEGLRSLARQRGLQIGMVNPCKGGSGECVLELTASKGQRWVFRRASSNAAWDRMEATWQGGAWWSPEWNWDSLRTASGNEFADLIGAWVSADADLAARNLLGPIEPVLSFPVSAWLSRSLPGMDFKRLSDSLAKQPTPAAGFELVRGPKFKASVDAMGRRRMEILP